MALPRRTRARELALQYLYIADVGGSPGGAGIADFLEMRSNDPRIREFALELAEGVLRDRERIDAEIRRVAANWDIGRMAVIDRNVLRLGVHELLDRPDVPARVTLYEAVELAKRYSTEASGAFVNGILDRIRRDHGRDPDRVAPLRAPAAAEEPRGETDESDEAEDVTEDAPSPTADREPESP